MMKLYNYSTKIKAASCILPIVSNGKVKEKLNLGPFAVKVKLTGLENGSAAEIRMFPFPQSTVNPESGIDPFLQSAVEKDLTENPESPMEVILLSKFNSKSIEMFVTAYICPV